jgi:hypothetical protein
MHLTFASIIVRLISYVVCRLPTLYTHSPTRPLTHSYTQRKDARERKSIKQDGGGDRGIGKRFVSQTAPAYDNRNHPQYKSRNKTGGGGGGGGMGGLGGGRVPTTKTSGTTTRRTDGAPTRRADTDSLQRLPSSAPAIAVTGLGGLRVIQDRRAQGNQGTGNRGNQGTNRGTQGTGRSAPKRGNR